MSGQGRGDTAHRTGLEAKRSGCNAGCSTQYTPFVRPSQGMENLPRLLVGPRVDQVHHLGHQGQIVAAETGRLLPLVAILVQPTDGDVVPRPVGLVLPDGGLDLPQANLMDGFLLGRLV